MYKQRYPHTHAKAKSNTLYYNIVENCCGLQHRYERVGRRKNTQNAAASPFYTLKDGVWPWRSDDKAIKNAQGAIGDTEQVNEAKLDVLKRRLEKREDVSGSLKKPIRNVKDILMDIAKYGTPAMQEAVDDIITLLAKLGYAPKNFNPEYGSANKWGNGDYMGSYRNQVIQKIKENSVRWQTANSEERKQLERKQQALGESIRATYNDHTGVWRDESGSPLFDADDMGSIQKEKIADETVLSPALSQFVITPEQNLEFANFAQSLGLIFGNSTQPPNAAFSREPVTHNHVNSHNICINGVRIGENMLQRPLSDTLSLLSLHISKEL